MRSHGRFSKPDSVRQFTRNRRDNLNLILRSHGGTHRRKLLCSFFYGFVRRFIGNGADKSGHDRTGAVGRGRRYRIAVNGRTLSILTISFWREETTEIRNVPGGRRLMACFARRGDLAQTRSRGIPDERRRQIQTSHLATPSLLFSRQQIRIAREAPAPVALLAQDRE